MLLQINDRQRERNLEGKKVQVPRQVTPGQVCSTAGPCSLCLVLSIQEDSSEVTLSVIPAHLKVRTALVEFD